VFRFTTSVFRRQARTMGWFSACVAILFLSAAAPFAKDYRIGAQDVVQIGVWEHPELTSKYAVAGDGTVTFPLVGPIKAAGLTAAELQAEVTKKLMDGFIKTPQVTVSVAEYLSQRVFVIGEVHTPGVVPLTGNLTLVEALTRAGSLTENAGGELQIVRAAPGSLSVGPTLPGSTGASVVLRASVQLLLRGQFATNAELTDGDTIVVPRAQSVSVLGQVKNPGAVPYEYDMTVLRAVSLVGGANDVGALGRARVIRIVDGKKTEIKAKETDTLQPGDVVMIPMKLW